MKDLLINTKIYNKKYIEEAVNNYRSIVEIDVKFDINKNEVSLDFKCENSNLELFKDEFCNHLIALIATSI